MKKFYDYINTMYRPSFLALSFGLAVFALGLVLLSLDLHADILAGKVHLQNEYASMLSELTYPLCILLPLTMLVDLNERRKK